MEKFRINFNDLLLCFSNALDLVSTRLSNHHQQVAYLSVRIAEYLNLPSEQQKDVFYASLVHDIGAISVKERLEIVENEPLHVNHHGFKGAKLLKRFKPLQHITDTIKYHHVAWDYGNGMTFEGEKVPYSSHILHIADRVCAMLKVTGSVLSQVPAVMSSIRERSGQIFDPALVAVMEELSKREYIWLDLISQSPVEKAWNITSYDTLSLDIDDIIDLAAVFSEIIDFRSKFTACHSAGVAKTAEMLARYFDFSPIECKMMLVAGYLHDLGKLAISNDILEKEGKLSQEEMYNMRSHTYFTYHLLEPIKELEIINRWASFHHERLDGTGYPFHIKGENLSLGARIMAVADVFTAITEDRPYRAGMNDERAANVLKEMSAKGALDSAIVNKILENYQEINEVRRNAQREASADYNAFLSNNN